MLTFAYRTIPRPARTVPPPCPVSRFPRIDFYTARDGRRLAVRVWNGIEPPRARVVLLHGITSHGGWYNRSCQHLNDCGFEVHFLDRRGSGLNAEGRGDVDRHATWLDDVTTYLEQIRRRRGRWCCAASVGAASWRRRWRGSSRA